MSKRLPPLSAQKLSIAVDKLKAMTAVKSNEPSTVMELVKSLSVDIEASLSRSSKWSDIVTMLTEISGWTINEGTVRNCMSRLRSKKQRSKSKPSLASATPSPAPPVQAPAVVKPVPVRPAVVQAPRQFEPPITAQPPRPSARPPLTKIDPTGAIPNFPVTFDEC